MQIAEVHALALQLLNSDTGDYDSTKLMAYTNDGIAYINNLRIQANDPEVIKSVTITADITKPDDFFGFIPQKSAYPLSAIGTTISRLPGAPPSVVFKYSTKPNRVSNINDTFPLPDEYAGYVASYISIRLQSDNSMNITQDMTMLDRDTTAFIKAKGG